MNQTPPLAREASATAPPASGGRVGVLLVNLGTPDGTAFAPMWRYLREFLSDPRVIEMPRYLWYPILYGLVLTTRPGRVGRNYARIWNRERDESPLKTFTRGQAEKLAARLADFPGIAAVEWGMRYGNPSTAGAVRRLMERGCDRLLSFPLYPQFSATTTATANDQLFRALMRIRHAPAVRSVPPYFAEPVYIEALARSVERHLALLDFEPEIVLASYHGIPRAYSERGDPYREHCLETTRLMRQRLGWSEARLTTTFQSRFGAQEWLQPYTDRTIERLARDGVKSLAVINPGFSSDCIETLDEIAVEGAHLFREAGGESFTHIPCLNDSDDGMAVIEALVRRELAGWT